jgi:hypothetical protein
LEVDGVCARKLQAGPEAARIAKAIRSVSQMVIAMPWLATTIGRRAARARWSVIPLSNLVQGLYVKTQA